MFPIGIILFFFFLFTMLIPPGLCYIGDLWNNPSTPPKVTRLVILIYSP